MQPLLGWKVAKTKWNTMCSPVGNMGWIQAKAIWASVCSFEKSPGPINVFPGVLVQQIFSTVCVIITILLK